jgi:GTP-binding protein
VEGRRPADERELEELDAKAYTRQIRATLKFMPYAPIIFSSAKTAYHVGNILDQALKIYDTRQIRVPTAQLNDVVKDAYRRHHPSYVQGRVLRIYYVTQAEVNPPTFVFFVNDPELLHFTYERYLENRLREVFGFEGTAIRLLFRARTTDEETDQARRERRAAKSGAGRKR